MALERMVLLVDRKEEDRAALRGMLDGLCQVLEAGKEDQALALLDREEGRIDAVLVDAAAADKGEELLERARQEEIPILLLLDTAEEELTAWGYGLGMADYLVRPYDRITVRNRVRNAAELCGSRRQGEWLRFMIDLSGELFVEYDARSGAGICFGPGRELFGVEEEIRGFRERIKELGIISGEALEEFRTALTSLKPGSDCLTREYLLNTVQGPRWFRIRGRAVWTNRKDSEYRGCILQLTDIHNMRADKERLTSMASRDALTKLNNRDAARKLVTQALRDEELAVFLFFDLDNFKAANDTWGHVFGDEVLVFVAKTISNQTRKGDICARIGGDEFLIFLRGITRPEVAEQQAARLVRALSRPVGDFPVSISMGVVVANAWETSWEELYAAADRMLYEAKRSGKGRYAFWDMNQGEKVEKAEGMRWMTPIEH